MIDVGTVLDKYELLERVGQGGMAVVYRGLDRSLRRQVAVKVLHRHLSDHAEARSRFEREAHAVAKLRHENILEIFDYSGTASEQSYIVTEFIEGQTLKQFVTDYQIKFPEIGAMICVQLCRALGHAHSLGILHRDVKPENVMIRTDGVVKLTDFGISQMVDMQRMTVTGQLLGSPAYMSPEHVEGRDLDFRTDVFAVGIVLYQLVVGKLPFEGRNPHEILKRIAECRYLDPRQANPAVGNELGRVIVRAMAREKADRFANVGEMGAALEQYLEGSGLQSSRDELGRFFKSPPSYEMALAQRLVDHLLRRGRALLGDNQTAALELFNRVLTIDPDNAAVHTELERLSRRRRGATVLVAIGAIALLAGTAWAARSWLTGGDGRAHDSDLALDAGELATDGPALALSSDLPGSGAAGSRGNPPRSSDAGMVDAGRPVRLDARGVERRLDAGASGARPDAGAPRPAGSFRLTVSPATSEVRLGDGPWQQLEDGSGQFAIGAGPLVVHARNPACCQEESRTIRPEQAGQKVLISLRFLPAMIIPRCAQPDVKVRIDGHPAKLGDTSLVVFPGSLAQKTIDVEFSSAAGVDVQPVTVKYNERREVTCALD